MKITDKRCPFRKFERESSIYRQDEEFQYCLGEECMACIELEKGVLTCGLIVKTILHQEVEVV
jgi:hypothetical protein